MASLSSSYWGIHMGLFLKEERFDGLNEETKNMVIFWWISETKVSLDKKDVASKRIRLK
jgi:hypothetical protein